MNVSTGDTRRVDIEVSRVRAAPSRSPTPSTLDRTLILNYTISSYFVFFSIAYCICFPAPAATQALFRLLRILTHVYIYIREELGKSSQT